MYGRPLLYCCLKLGCTFPSRAGLPSACAGAAAAPAAPKNVASVSDLAANIPQTISVQMAQWAQSSFKAATGALMSEKGDMSEDALAFEAVATAAAAAAAAAANAVISAAGDSMHRRIRDQVTRGALPVLLQPVAGQRSQVAPRAWQHEKAAAAPAANASSPSEAIADTFRTEGLRTAGDSNGSLQAAGRPKAIEGQHPGKNFQAEGSGAECPLPGGGDSAAAGSPGFAATASPGAAADRAVALALSCRQLDAPAVVAAAAAPFSSSAATHLPRQHLPYYSQQSGSNVAQQQQRQQLALSGLLLPRAAANAGGHCASFQGSTDGGSRSAAGHRQPLVAMAGGRLRSGLRAGSSSRPGLGTSGAVPLSSGEPLRGFEQQLDSGWASEQSLLPRGTGAPTSIEAFPGNAVDRDMRGKPCFFHW